MLNIDALLDNHARFLARRYNLTAEQDAFTQALLRQKTEAFLAKHREELFDLVDRLVEVRAGGEIAQQELINWGRRALPLYEEAKTLIIEGNNEWRQILTEEQRRTHDEDLREMYDSFATTESQLQRIVSGQMTVEEFRHGPGRQVPQRSATAAPAAPPPQPTATVTDTTPPVAGQVAPPTTVTRPPQEVRQLPDRRSAAPGATSPAAPIGPGAAAARQPPTVYPAGVDPLSQWEAYVRDFIQRYQLDEAQTARANAILKECQEAANRLIERRKAEFERIDKQLQELSQSPSPDKIKQLTELNERRNKLLEPINEIFEKQLKPRLEKLPTRAQKQAAEQSGRPGPNKSPTPARPPTPLPRPQPTPPPPQPQPQPTPEPLPPPDNPPDQPVPEPPVENPPE